jgi:hypothetical protein
MAHVDDSGVQCRKRGVSRSIRFMSLHHGENLSQIRRFQQLVKYQPRDGLSKGIPQNNLERKKKLTTKKEED